MKFSKYILEQARLNGICEPWADKIANANSVDDLLQMYVEGIDFCLKNKFPSNTDLIRLGGSTINQYGIYVDSTKKLVDRHFVVALGESNISLSLANYSVSHVFVKDKSIFNISVNDNAFVVIDCFDESTVNVVAGGYSRVMVNVYGNAIVSQTINGNGVVKVVRKYKKSY